jgi:hypothetical protein
MPQIFPRKFERSRDPETMSADALAAVWREWKGKQPDGTQADISACWWMLVEHLSGSEVAQAEWNGIIFTAGPTRHGATHDLCRMLVAAGCPDQPMRVYRRTDSLHQYSFRSIHKAATMTVKEGFTVRARPGRWVPPEQVAAAFGKVVADS